MVKALEDIMLQFAAEVGDVSLSASVQEMGLISGAEDCELTLCVLLDGDASGDKTECVVFPVFC